MHNCLDHYGYYDHGHNGHYHMYIKGRQTRVIQSNLSERIEVENKYIERIQLFMRNNNIYIIFKDKNQ